MSRPRLNQRQRALLARLVAHAEAGRLVQPFVPIPFGDPTSYVIHILGAPSLRFRQISDLDALCDAGLLAFELNRQGTGKRYLLTDDAFARVRDAENAPATAAGLNAHLNEVVQTMGGGALAEFSGHEATLGEIARDPLARVALVDAVLDRYLADVRPALDGRSFLTVEQRSRRLRSALLAPRPDDAALSALLRELAFVLPDVTPARLSRNWVLLYPLVVIAAGRQAPPGDV